MKRGAKLSDTAQERYTPGMLAFPGILLLWGLMWAWWSLIVPWMGDDLNYSFHYHDHIHQPAPWLHFAWGIWNGANARLGDMLNPVPLYILPRPLTALLVGAGAALSLWCVVRLAMRRGAGRVWQWIVLLAMLLIMPWRDINFIVCHTGYVWGTAASGLILIALLRHRLRSLWWLLLLPAVAMGTAMHEALGFPLGFGVAVWLLVNHKWRGFTMVQKWWTVALLAGAVFCITSPASYSRVGEGNPPDLPLVPLILTTLPLVLLLLVRIVWLAWKGGLGALIHSQWLIFALAAFGSAGFTLLGGIEGRGGWYAQSFALIALGYDLSGRWPLVAMALSRGARRLVRGLQWSCLTAALVFIALMTERETRIARLQQEVAVAYEADPADPALFDRYLTLPGGRWSYEVMPLWIGRPAASLDGTYYFHPRNTDPWPRLGRPAIWLVPHPVTPRLP